MTGPGVGAVGGTQLCAGGRRCAARDASVGPQLHAAEALEPGARRPAAARVALRQRRAPLALALPVRQRWAGTPPSVLSLEVWQFSRLHVTDTSMEIVVNALSC